MEDYLLLIILIVSTPLIYFLISYFTQDKCGIANKKHDFYTYKSDTHYYNDSVLGKVWYGTRYKKCENCGKEIEEQL